MKTTAACLILLSSLSADGLKDRAEKAISKAGRYWAEHVSSHGGYVWEYSTDFKRRRGENGDLPPTTLWVQPPGTPAVGEALLRGYEATDDKALLAGAVQAAKCLAWGQLASGGWGYSIEYDPARYRYRYHHLSPDTPNFKKLSNTTTFDDNNTQSATRFLMNVSRHVKEVEIETAIKRALTGFMEAQYKGGPWDGAWPQRFPPPTKGYGRLPTFNDNTMSDCVRTMLHAWKQYDKEEYQQSLERCLEFYLRSQMPEPQAGWAQQYDESLKPAWARKFEPPAVSGAESCGNIQVLVDMYIELGDKRYLDAAEKAANWYRRSRIGGDEKRGQWARFYEVTTNRPLYFTRTYELVYTDDDLPIHYSFQGQYGVDRRLSLIQDVRKKGRKHYLAQREQRDLNGIRAGLEPAVKKILDEMDELGRWVKKVKKSEKVRDSKGRLVLQVDENTELAMLYSKEFTRNIKTLADYVATFRKNE